MDVTEFSSVLVILLVVIAVAGMFVFNIGSGLNREKQKFQEIYRRAGFSAFGSTLKEVGCYKGETRPDPKYFYYFVVKNVNFQSLQETKFKFLAVGEFQRTLALGTATEKRPLTETLLFPDDQSVTIAFWFPGIGAPRAEGAPLFISFWGDSDCVRNHLGQPGADFVKLSEECGAYYLYSAHTSNLLVKESTCRPALCPNYEETACKASKDCYFDPGTLGLGRGCKGCPAHAATCGEYGNDNDIACTGCAQARGMCYWDPGGFFGGGKGCKECPPAKRCVEYEKAQCTGCASAYCQWTGKNCASSLWVP